ncbi:MAG TPA: ATP synthase F1 subunit gamma [Gaiellales bacterium]|jgi:F-type H+-transporting ATPase subunit gamma|nr:ATP synthase F1 subunit gamma [Gaiellales bacterium]
MASQQDIKRRIQSVRNTRKITKALELVSASKLRRAQLRIEALRPYADRMRELMIEAASYAHVPALPLLTRREPGRVGIIVLTGDRGLAGAFNGQVVRRALQVGSEHAAQGHEVVYLPAGRKGLGTLRFRGRDVLTSWTGFSDRPEYADAEGIADLVTKAYIGGELDLVVLVYNRFVSALQQQVEDIELLPIPEGDLEGLDAKERAEQGEMLFEPDAEEMLSELLVSSLEVTVYRALLESTASEHGARMTAMRNASENAGDLISQYTLAMNRARQAEITQEILEVVAGADALQ